MGDTLPAAPRPPPAPSRPGWSRTLLSVTPQTGPAPAIAGAEIAFLSWRDTSNPEGGGAERALEQVAEGLVDQGARVTVFSAAYPGALPEEVVRGVRYVRRGSKLSVYLRGMQSLASGLLGRPRVVVDVQNGLPFFSRVVTRRPVVVWCHHVHREQWPVVYPGRMGTVGWWIESRLSPWLYRRSRYVTGSHATRDELVELGVDARRISVIHYGTDRARPVQTVTVRTEDGIEVGRVATDQVTVSYARLDDDTIIATTGDTGIRTFLADGPKLADGDAYKRAADAVDMGEKTRGFVYVDVDGVLPLAEQAGASLPPDASDAISAVDSFILEATGAGDVTKVSGFVRLND